MAQPENGRPPFSHIIHQTWKTATLPDNFRKWRQSWLDAFPEWEHRLWTDETNREFIATQYSWFLPYYDEYPHNIQRVDAVRYFWLYRFGGVYADLDFECLRPFESELERDDRDVVLGQMGADGDFEHSVPNALMASRPGAQFWELVFEELVKHRHERSVEGSTGPVLLHTALRRWKMLAPEQCLCRVVVLPPVAFYPVDWNSVDGQALRRRVVGEGRELTREEAKTMFPNSYAVTYWTQTWGQGKASALGVTLPWLTSPHLLVLSSADPRQPLALLVARCEGCPALNAVGTRGWVSLWLTEHSFDLARANQGRLPVGAPDNPRETVAWVSFGSAVWHSAGGSIPAIAGLLGIPPPPV